MAVQARDALKSWFETGDYPTQENFWDLIDSFIHRNEDNLAPEKISFIRGQVSNAKDALDDLYDKVEAIDTDISADEVNYIHGTYFNVRQALDALFTAISPLASTEYVDTKIADLIASAPAVLDTLQELANALGNDPGFATTIAGQIGSKANTADLTAHTTNTSNPHGVTKAQVGLANADDTSDADKPISIAQQAALDTKANVSDMAAQLQLKQNASPALDMVSGVNTGDETKATLETKLGVEGLLTTSKEIVGAINENRANITASTVTKGYIIAMSIALG